VTKFAGWKAVYKTNSEDNELPVLKQEDKLNLKNIFAYLAKSCCISDV